MMKLEPRTAPYRIELLEGHLRFTNLRCAIESAIHYGLPIHDDERGQVIERGRFFQEADFREPIHASNF